MCVNHFLCVLISVEVTNSGQQVVKVALFENVVITLWQRLDFDGSEIRISYLHHFVGLCGNYLFQLKPVGMEDSFVLMDQVEGISSDINHDWLQQRLDIDFQQLGETL